jgi:signal transduction histidine kinase
MEADEQPSSIDLRGKKILVVDDDRLNVRILSNILRTEGYVISPADSGEHGLEVYESFKPDLVLLDVVMPGINGFETCRAIKRRYGEDSAPIIFITAKNESEDVVEGLSAGGVDYLSKPFRGKEALARIRTHLHMQELMKQQKSLVEQLSKANAAKNKFLGMAAHDLRNPLASIRGLAEFLLEGIGGPLSADQKDLVNTIHDASQSMLVLVNELLDVATIESGELKILPETKNLTSLIEKSVFLGNIEAGKKGSRIEFQSSTRQALVRIDGAKMRQVIDNLLSNALKYSPPSSLITVGLQPSERGWSISVRDQGPGIPEDERDRLFKDFSRLSVRTTAGEKSTGLGLAICRKIIDAHNGSINARNLPEGGCEFTVHIPTNT